MGGSDERERIEVELVSTAGPASPFSRSAPDGAVIEAGRAQPGGGTNRAAVIATIVGVVALGFGWALGRAGADGTSAVQPSVTAAITNTEPDQAIEAVPVTQAPSPTTIPTPTVPGTESAATPSGEQAVPATQVSDVEVAAAVRGLPIEIVAFGNGRQLFQLDLTSSRLLTTEVDTQPFGRTVVLVAPDWVLLPSNDAALPSTVVRPDGSATEVELGASWQVAGIADEGSIWQVGPSSEGADTHIQRRSIRGDFGEEVAGLPEFPSGVDPAGGVILELPGRIVRVEPQPAIVDPSTGAARGAVPIVEEITSGRLLALSATVAVVEECADDLTCARIVVDRATGDRRVLDDAGVHQNDLAPYGPVALPSVSPDGRLAVVELLEPSDRASSQRSLGVMDLATGSVDEIGPTQDVGQVAWSPDGRFVLHISGGRIAAYDTETAETVVIVGELVAIGSFGIRPVDR